MPWYGRDVDGRQAVEPIQHGKPSRIIHSGTSVFTGLPSPLTAGRYHSLYVIRETLPPELEILAESEDGMIMALRHASLPIASFQFHPESILTLAGETGQRLMENLFTHFLDTHRPALDESGRKTG